MVRRAIEMFRALKAERDSIDAVAIFRRLYAWERVALCCAVFVACVLVMGGMFSSNVIPHYLAIFGENGFDSGEFTKSMDVTGSVVLLAVLSLLLMARWLTWTHKALMLGVALLLLHGNLKNSAGIQARAREAKDAPFSQHSSHIAYLKKEIARLEPVWNGLVAQNWAVMPDIAVTASALENLKQSAKEECHYGKPGRERGPICTSKEQERDKKASELQALVILHTKEIQDTLPAFKKELASYGDADKPVETDAELTTSSALYADMGAPAAAAFIVKHDSMIEAITMDAKVLAFLGPSIMGIFWFFGIISANRGEAERRVFECMPDFAEAVAKVAADKMEPDHMVRNLEPDAPPAVAKHDPEPVSWYEAYEPEESVLDIVGKDAPAFADAPITPMEHLAAATIKADPERPTARRARRKVKSEDSAKLWWRERCVARPGRTTPQHELYADYNRWCMDLNLDPMDARQFGRTLRKEIGLEGYRNKSNNYVYVEIGLKPHLKIVA